MARRASKSTTPITLHAREKRAMKRAVLTAAARLADGTAPRGPRAVYAALRAVYLAAFDAGFTTGFNTGFDVGGMFEQATRG